LEEIAILSHKDCYIDFTYCKTVDSKNLSTKVFAVHADAKDIPGATYFIFRLSIQFPVLRTYRIALDNVESEENILRAIVLPSNVHI
jgi:hypothetical protein